VLVLLPQTEPHLAVEQISCKAPQVKGTVRQHHESTSMAFASLQFQKLVPTDSSHVCGGGIVCFSL
jgi:hypothetical protein